MNGTTIALARAELTVGRSLYPEIVASQDRIGDLVREAASALGVPPLGLTVTFAAELAPRAFRLALSGASNSTLQVEGLPTGAVLVRSSPPYVRAQFDDKDQRAPEVQRWPDPARPNRTASIICDVTLDRVRAKFDNAALTAVGAVEVAVVLWFRHAVVDGFDEISAAQLVAQLPVYDAAALLRTCPIDKVTDVLKALLRDGIPLVDFALIAPLLADESRVSWTGKGSVVAAYRGHQVIASPRPEEDSERRRVIARSVAVPRWLRRRAGAGPLQAWVLDDTGGWVPTDDAAGDDVASFDAQLLAQAEPAAATDEAILLTSPSRRGYISERIRPRYPDLPVVGLHELPRGVPLQRRGVVRIPDPSKSASRS